MYVCMYVYNDILDITIIQIPAHTYDFSYPFKRFPQRLSLKNIFYHFC